MSASTPTGPTPSRACSRPRRAEASVATTAAPQQRRPAAVTRTSLSRLPALARLLHVEDDAAAALFELEADAGTESDDGGSAFAAVGGGMDPLLEADTALAALLQQEEYEAATWR